MTLDPLKVTIRADGMTGFELSDALEAIGILLEFANFQNVLFVLPLAVTDYTDDMLEKIASIRYERKSDHHETYALHAKRH